MKTLTHTISHTPTITNNSSWQPTSDQVAELSNDIRQFDRLATEATIDTTGKVYVTGSFATHIKLYGFQPNH